MFNRQGSDLSVRHIPALDGLRGVAVLLVVAFHVGFVLHPSGPGFPKTYAPGGFAGVDVFFVLSGFLITSLLLEERQRQGNISFRRFYARRAFRLLPALGLLLVAHLVYAAYQGIPLRGEAKALLSITFYGSNITQSLHLFMPAELIHTWSLAVEEQFYLVWPSLLLVLLAWRSSGARRSKNVLAWTLFGSLVATNVACVLTWRTQGYPAAYMMPYCHADGLIIGCAAAFLWRQGQLPVRGAGVVGWAGFVGLIAFTFVWTQGPGAGAVYYGGYALIALAAAAMLNALLVGGSGNGLGALLSWRPLRAVGKVSYGLYLWHAMILTILDQHTLGLGPLPRAVVGLALSAAATAGSWYFLEQPFLRLKDRYRPRVSEPRLAVPEPA